MNIAILTAGGDCPGLNPFIRAVVKAAHFSGKIDKVYGVLDGFEGLYADTDKMYRLLTPKDVKNIQNYGGTILGSTNKGIFGEIGDLKDASPEAQAAIAKIKENFQKLGIEALVLSGGDGSLRIAHWVGKNVGVNVVGVPKTIDNDIMNTDVSIGFNTAVQTATEAIHKIEESAQSHHRTMVVEVMGRTVGWIALQSGIAAGANVILIPEITFDRDKVVEFVNNRIKNNITSTIIVFAEGARDKTNTDPKAKHGGVDLVKYLEEHVDTEVRLSVLGYMQRGGSPTAFDRMFATRCGQKAVECVLNDEQYRFIRLRHGAIEDVPLSEASDQTKSVPLDHDLLKTARALGISFGD